MRPLPRLSIVNVLLLLCSALPCFAVTYIGCFLASDLEKDTPYTSAGSITNEWTCNKVCESLSFPLSYVSQSGDCRCSSLIPSYLDLQYDSLCDPTVMAGIHEEAVRLQYAHSDSAQQCSLAPLPFSNYFWSQTDFKSEGMVVDGSSPPSFVELKVNPSLGVITFNSLDSWSYGMYSMQTFGKSPGDGASLSFYVTSDTYIPQRSAWDEVDLVLTSLPSGSPWAPDERLDGIWVNTWKSGQNFSTTAVPWNKTIPATTDNGTYNQDAYRTYAFNWQKNQITWYVDGVPFFNITDSRIIPSQPASVVFAFWVADDFNCQRFGGCASTNSMFQTTIRDVRRIVCGAAEQIAALRVRSGVKAALPYPSPPQPPNPPTPLSPPSIPPIQPPAPDDGLTLTPDPSGGQVPGATPAVTPPTEGAPPAPQSSGSETTPPGTDTSTYTSSQNANKTQQQMTKAGNVTVSSRAVAPVTFSLLLIALVAGAVCAALS